MPASAHAVAGPLPPAVPSTSLCNCSSVLSTWKKHASTFCGFLHQPCAQPPAHWMQSLSNSADYPQPGPWAASVCLRFLFLSNLLSSLLSVSDPHITSAKQGSTQGAGAERRANEFQCLFFHLVFFPPAPWPGSGRSWNRAWKTPSTARCQRGKPGAAAGIMAPVANTNTCG